MKLGRQEKGLGKARCVVHIARSGSGDSHDDAGIEYIIRFGAG